MLSRARNYAERNRKRRQSGVETKRITARKGTRSGLGVLGLGGLARFSRSRGCRSIFHPLFQGTISFAQPFAQLRQLLRTENQQGNGKNDDQVPRLEQTFHGEPPEKTLQNLFLYTVPEGYGKVNPPPGHDCSPAVQAAVRRASRPPSGERGRPRLGRQDAG